ncbi:MAG: tripartite tricarboxylate transporter substrate binding protein [Betaproteobacteria bacterium]|nr:tripartite tricarboxylate transporter substrate binding protein [Betaproteobacteria bacterium]
MEPLTRIGRAIFFVALSLASSGASAQGYPSGPIRLVVPYPPGGAASLVGHSLGEKLKEALGQPVIVEHRPGAAANTGTDFVAKSAPDGLTLLLGTNGPLVINVSLMGKLPFDPLKDFAPISYLASIPLALVVHAGVPANSLKELIALAKARPGKLNYASSGEGSGGHLAGALLASMGEIQIAHVPYKGAGPALTDIVGGHVDMLFVGYVSVMPHVKSGKLKALAMATPKRATAAPGIPAVAETLPGFEIDSWYGLLAPAGTPPAIIATLHRETVKALQSPDVKEKLFVQGGLEYVGSTPEQFAASLRREIPQYARVVKLTGAKNE